MHISANVWSLGDGVVKIKLKWEPSVLLYPWRWRKLFRRTANNDVAAPSSHIYANGRHLQQHKGHGIAWRIYNSKRVIYLLGYCL